MPGLVPVCRREPTPRGESAIVQFSTPVHPAKPPRFVRTRSPAGAEDPDGRGTASVDCRAPPSAGGLRFIFGTDRANVPDDPTPTTFTLSGGVVDNKVNANKVSNGTV